MLHRDISLNNLMCEYREGSVWLILNDFDLATRVDDTGMPMGDGLSERQMGTLPFMSLDVLANVTASPHCLWHDLESAFWVALWCLVTLPRSKDADEEKTRRAALLDWERGGLKAIRNTKGAILARYQELDALPLTPEMQPYRPWIALFWRVFSLAYANINDRKTRAILPKYAGYGEVEPMLEPETLDGAVSCAGIRKDLSIWEALDSGEVEGFIRYSPTL